MTSVSRQVKVELHVSRSFKAMLEDAGAWQEWCLDFLEAGAKHLVGGHEGETPSASAIGRHFTRSNKERYGFAPLSPQYAKRKRKLVGNKPILVFSGKWKKAALDAKVLRRGKQVVLKPRRKPDYADYLEKGTKTMPARPAFTLNAEDRRGLGKFWNRYLKDSTGELASAMVGDLERVV